MNMDYMALNDSEVMTSYLKAEMLKEANLQKKEVNEGDIISAFSNFEKLVKGDKKMSLAFKTLQDRFKSDPAYAQSCDPLFVQAVAILDLDEQG